MEKFPRKMESMESIKSAEEQPVKPIKLTQAELSLLANNFRNDDPKAIEVMRQKGLTFDGNGGVVDVEVDGRPEMMSTQKDDFGTLVEPGRWEEVRERKRRRFEESN